MYAATLAPMSARVNSIKFAKNERLSAYMFMVYLIKKDPPKRVQNLML